MNKKRKINNASYNVFKTLLKLFNENLTMDELIEKSNKEGTTEFTNFVISKYINTCKSCSLDIQKMGGKYSLVNFPFGPKYTQQETKLLCDITEIIDALGDNSEEQKQIIKNLITKLHIPYFKSSNGLKSSENYRLIRLFEKACALKTNLVFTLPNNTTETYTPINIEVKDEKILFKVKSGEKEKYINPENIIDIEPVDKKIRKSRISETTVEFILKDKLAKRYQPRENEVISLIKRNGDIVVTNKFEDKEELLRRLMRYDISCKLINPKSYVEDLKKMINDAIKNYQ